MVVTFHAGPGVLAVRRHDISAVVMVKTRAEAPSMTCLIMSDTSGQKLAPIQEPIEDVVARIQRAFLKFSDPEGEPAYVDPARVRMIAPHPEGAIIFLYNLDNFQVVVKDDCAEVIREFAKALGDEIDGPMSSIRIASSLSATPFLASLGHRQ